MTQENSANSSRRAQSESNKFDLSISKMTLRFIDPIEELKFAEKFKVNIRLNTVLIIGTIALLTYQYVYRIQRLVYAIQYPDDLNTTLHEEIVLFIIATIVLFTEIFLKVTGYCQFYHGFILYVAIPIIAVYAGFAANSSPVLGVSYFYS